MRAVDRLVSPSAPSRMHRTTGYVWIGFGCLFLLPALFNLAVAIRELTR
ncbi:hypothetical protein [Streptomyces griseorubiginosus]